MNARDIIAAIAGGEQADQIIQALTLRPQRLHIEATNRTLIRYVTRWEHESG